MFEPLTLLYGVPKTHYFSSNSKIPRVKYFVLIWDYQKCKNGWFQVSGLTTMTQGLKHNHQNQSGKYLGTMVYENLDRGLFEVILGFCQVIRNCLHFLG